MCLTHSKWRQKKKLWSICEVRLERYKHTQETLACHKETDNNAAIDRMTVC